MKQWVGVAAGVLWVFAATGQQMQEQPGIYKGDWVLTPSVGVLGAYDSRVLTDQDRSGAKSDTYGETGAAAILDNLGGRYDLKINALYAYRFYSNYNELNDDRYNLGIRTGSENEALSWTVKGDIRKTLDYNTTVDFSTGQTPDEILSDGTKHTYTLNAGTGYEGRISDKVDLTPSYAYQFFFEDAEDADDNRKWQIHRAALQWGYRYSDLTKGTFTGSYAYSMDEDNDNGHVVQLMIGAENQITDLTTWSAQIGIAAAKYDSSGSDQALVSNLRGTWQTTEKVSSYIFGGNGFQPGYDEGGARMIYRLGYGADWNMRERWDSGIQMLHSYEKPIDDSTDTYSEKVKTFVSARVSHIMGKNLALGLMYRYVHDDFDEDEHVVSLRLRKKY